MRSCPLEAYRTITIKDTLLAMAHGRDAIGDPRLAADRAALRERWYAEGWFGATDLAAAFLDQETSEGTVVFAAPTPPAPTKTCPECLSTDLPAAATKCLHCSSVVGESAA